MSQTPGNQQEIQRPEFMITLGLLPPYAVEDVRMAYREKAKEAHPDRGGSHEEFLRLQQAYEKALEYAEFRKSRRHWLGAQMERYICQEEILAEVRRLGGEVEIEPVDWMKNSIGPDFSVVAERLRRISLRGLKEDNTFLLFLSQRPKALEFLTTLELTDCRLSNSELTLLPTFFGLKRLYLRDSKVPYEVLQQCLAEMPDLKQINITGSGLGWIAKKRFQWAYPKVEIIG